MDKKSLVYTKVGLVRRLVRPGFVRRLVRRALCVGLWALGLCACSLRFCTRVACWAEPVCTANDHAHAQRYGHAEAWHPYRLCALEWALCVLVRKLCFWLCALFVRLPAWVGAHDSIGSLRTSKFLQFLSNPCCSWQILSIPCKSLLFLKNPQYFLQILTIPFPCKTLTIHYKSLLFLVNSYYSLQNLTNTCKSLLFLRNPYYSLQILTIPYKALLFLNDPYYS